MNKEKHLGFEQPLRYSGVGIIRIVGTEHRGKEIKMCESSMYK